MAYINYEIEQGQLKRATFLYERALSSSSDMQNNIHMWLSYMNFIQEKLNDVTTAKAKYEQKLKDAHVLKTESQIDLLIENALFEEILGNHPRARKIYEQLDQDIAPGLIKASIARINFEKRCGNNDKKVREIYYKVFEDQLAKNEGKAVAHVASQYSRYLAFKCNDQEAAMNVYNQAIQKP